MSLPASFPFAKVFPAQLEAMLEVRRAVLAGERLLLELPLGRHAALLATLMDFPDKQIIWCARTPREQLEALVVIGDLRKHRASNALVAVPWLSCPTCETCGTDAACSSLSDVVSSKDKVWLPDELKAACTEAKKCTRQTSAMLAASARVVVLANHEDFLDPKLAFPVKVHRNCIVVFDDAVNLDSTCTNVMSVHLTRSLLASANADFVRICEKLESASQARRLDQEYSFLVDSPVPFNPYSPLLSPLDPASYMPGSLRRAHHFMQILTALLGYLKSRIDLKDAFVHTPTRFLFDLSKETFLDHATLKYVHCRLFSLGKTLDCRLQEWPALLLVCQFISIIAAASSDSGFRVVFEPTEPGDTGGVRNPCLQAVCLDARAVLRARTRSAHSVIVSGPAFAGAAILTKILGLQSQYLCTLAQKVAVPVWPVIVDRSSDQQGLSASSLTEPALLRYYAALLRDVVATVPDGVVVYFSDYVALERVLIAWHDSRFIADLIEHKLVFCETLDAKETAFALDEYYNACEVGRGAIFLTYARGRVAEAVRFGRLYARATVVLGYPEEKRGGVARARAEYLNVHIDVTFHDLHAYDTAKAVVTCLARSFCGSKDWGVLCLADVAYVRPSVRSKLPRWMQELLSAQDDSGVRSQDVFARLLWSDFVQHVPLSSFTKLQRGKEVDLWMRRIRAKRDEERARESALAAAFW